MTARRWLLPALAGIAAVALGLGAAELAAAIVAPTASPRARRRLAAHRPRAVVGEGDRDRPVRHRRQGRPAGRHRPRAARRSPPVAGVLQWRRPPLGPHPHRRRRDPRGRRRRDAVERRRSWMPFPRPSRRSSPWSSLGFLLRKAPRRRGAPQSTPDARPGDPTRRAFLGWTGGAAALGALAAVGGTLLAVRRPGRDRGPRRVHPAESRRVTAPPIPAGAELGIPGLATVITPNAEFYRIDTALQIPRIDPSTWSLRITGEVENEIELTWDELIALPLEESVHDPDVRLERGRRRPDRQRALARLPDPRGAEARASRRPAPTWCCRRSIDGFTAGTPLEVLLEDDRNAIFAIGMNGEPLPEEHGFPVRMVVPGLYGYVSATKWVVELEVTRFDRASAYWTDRGWGERGPIKIESRIDVAKRDGGGLLVAGVAWHQHTGIDEGRGADRRRAVGRRRARRRDLDRHLGAVALPLATVPSGDHTIAGAGDRRRRRDADRGCRRTCCPTERPATTRSTSRSRSRRARG